GEAGEGPQGTVQGEGGGDRGGVVWQLAAGAVVRAEAGPEAVRLLPEAVARMRGSDRGVSAGDGGQKQGGAAAAKPTEAEAGEERGALRGAGAAVPDGGGGPDPDRGDQ